MYVWSSCLKRWELGPSSTHMSIVLNGLLTFLHVSMYCCPTSCGYSMMRKIQPNIHVSDTTAHKSNITKWNPYHNETIFWAHGQKLSFQYATQNSIRRTWTSCHYLISAWAENWFDLCFAPNASNRLQVCIIGSLKCTVKMHHKCPWSCAKLLGY